VSNQPRIYTGSELDVILRAKLEQGIQFRICERSTELCRFSGGIPGQIDWSLDSIKVRDAAERINLIQISTEFYPSSASQQLSDAGVKFDDHRDDDWPGWFRRITEGAFLLPDTNILLKRTITSVIFPRFMLRRRGLALPFKIAMPRLSILELENLANSERAKARASKGECFMAFNEVRMLKKAGASLTEPLSTDDLSAFYRVAGKRLVDAFLREEVRRFGFSKSIRVVFLTRDMISALTANSEDLDAIYMAPKFPEQLSLSNVGIPEIRELLIELATDCSKITLHWNDGTSAEIEGIWSGKNWFDYYKRRVRVTPNQ